MEPAVVVSFPRFIVLGLFEWTMARTNDPFVFWKAYQPNSFKAHGASEDSVDLGRARLLRDKLCGIGRDDSPQESLKSFFPRVFEKSFPETSALLSPAQRFDFCDAAAIADYNGGVDMATLKAALTRVADVVLPDRHVSKALREDPKLADLVRRAGAHMRSTDGLQDAKAKCKKSIESSLTTLNEVVLAVEKLEVAQLSGQTRPHIAALKALGNDSEEARKAGLPNDADIDDIAYESFVVCMEVIATLLDTVIDSPGKGTLPGEAEVVLADWLRAIGALHPASNEDCLSAEDVAACISQTLRVLKFFACVSANASVIPFFEMEAARPEFVKVVGLNSERRINDFLGGEWVGAKHVAAKTTLASSCEKHFQPLKNEMARLFKSAPEIVVAMDVADGRPNSEQVEFYIHTVVNEAIVVEGIKFARAQIGDAHVLWQLTALKSSSSLANAIAQLGGHALGVSPEDNPIDSKVRTWILYTTTGPKRRAIHIYHIYVSFPGPRCRIHAYLMLCYVHIYIYIYIYIYLSAWLV
jgi:hypothetical protein